MKLNNFFKTILILISSSGKYNYVKAFSTVKKVNTLIASATKYMSAEQFQKIN